MKTHMKTLTPDDRGTFEIGTKTGSRYTVVISDDDITLRRVPESGPLRHDGDVIAVKYFSALHEGAPAFFALEPLTPENGASVTQRTTSAVTLITRCA